MKLEKHRYEDVVILKFTGEFDTFNLPAFSERIDRMIEGGDTQMVFDLRLLKFINSSSRGPASSSRRPSPRSGWTMSSRCSSRSRRA